MNKNKTKYYLILIIFLGLLLRLYKINSPILDLYPMRQEQCAMIARNFFRHGYNIFHLQVDWFGNLDSSWRIELPLSSYITAILYLFFGLHEFLGRLVSIFFSLGAIYLVFKLANKLFNEKVALLSAILFAVSPLSVYFGRAFMSDMAMVFFSLAAIYYFYKWAEAQGRLNYLWALTFLSLACLIKLPALYLLLPLGYLAYVKHKDRVFVFNRWLFIFFIFPILVSLFWYMGASDNLFIWIFKKSSWGYLSQPDFYRRIFESLSIFVLTPLGAILAFLGILLPVAKKEKYLMHIWLFAVVASTLITAGPSYVHYHYQLPFVPVFCIFAAKAIVQFSKPEVWEHTLLTKINAHFAIGIILSLMGIMSLLSIQPFYNWNATVYRAAKIADKLVEKGAVVICGRSTQEAPLYYVDRKGWETNEGPAGSLSYSWAANLNKYCFPKKDNQPLFMPDEPELIKFLIKYGADYYFTTNMNVLNEEPRLKDFLYANFTIVKEEKDFVIFHLKKRK